MGCTASVRFLLLAFVAGCAGCATRPAPDISGRWKPVNHFAQSVQEIPLHQSYVFYPSPMDRTLKNMLERWAVDSSTPLRYLHPSDFTLHGRVAAVRTGSLAEAIRALNAVYLDHGVAIALEDGQIMVTQAGTRMPLAAGSAGVGNPTAP